MNYFISHLLVFTLRMASFTPAAAVITSCRPTCLSFQVNRSMLGCHRTGAFVDSESSPWRHLSASPCSVNNDAPILPQNLSLVVHETGSTYRVITTHIDLQSEDVFTYCSRYQCPPTECAIAEQMGSLLQINFHHAGAYGDLVMLMTLGLSTDFVGDPKGRVGLTQFGPLGLLWMDDPFSCRTDEEVNLPDDDSIDPDNGNMSNPLITDVFDMSVEESQRKALRILFQATQMDSVKSRPSHNWFVNDDENYCTFTGVTCDKNKYVIRLDLEKKGLSGTLPSSIGDLAKLHRLMCWKNEIGGTLPPSLSSLVNLRHINLEENQFSGAPFPENMARLTKLKGYLIQANSFVGTIPPDLCQLQRMKVLDLADNSGIFGTLPSCLTNLDELRVLRIRNLELTGTVPVGLCGVRDFNGLAMNTLGCAALACPSGTFLRGQGRQTRGDKPCRPCSVPSNVIGSTSCRWVDEMSKTPTPTEVSSTFYPSIEQTLSPSTMIDPFADWFQPSSVPTFSLTTSRSDGPSASPTLLIPGDFLEPSIHPTSSTTMVASQDSSPPQSLFVSPSPTMTVSREHSSGTSIHPTEINVIQTGSTLRTVNPTIKGTGINDANSNFRDGESSPALKDAVVILVVGLVALVAAMAVVTKYLVEASRERNFDAQFRDLNNTPFLEDDVSASGSMSNQVLGIQAFCVDPPVAIPKDGYDDAVAVSTRARRVVGQQDYEIGDKPRSILLNKMNGNTNGRDFDLELSSNTARQQYNQLRSCLSGSSRSTSVDRSNLSVSWASSLSTTRRSHSHSANQIPLDPHEDVPKSVKSPVSVPRRVHSHSLGEMPPSPLTMSWASHSASLSDSRSSCFQSSDEGTFSPLAASRRSVPHDVTPRFNSRGSHSHSPGEKPLTPQNSSRGPQSAGKRPLFVTRGRNGERQLSWARKSHPCHGKLEKFLSSNSKSRVEDEDNLSEAARAPAKDESTIVFTSSLFLSPFPSQRLQKTSRDPLVLPSQELRNDEFSNTAALPDVPRLHLKPKVSMRKTWSQFLNPLNERSMRVEDEDVADMGIYGSLRDYWNGRDSFSDGGSVSCDSECEILHGASSDDIDMLVEEFMLEHEDEKVDDVEPAKGYIAVRSVFHRATRSIPSWIPVNSHYTG